MELTVDQALQQAVAAHKEGKLQDAERLYLAILQAQPNHPDANHNLGVLAVAVGKPIKAIPLFKLALDANPQIEKFWLSYIDVLIKVERFDEAKRALVESEKSGVSSDKLDALNQRLQESAPNDPNKTVKGQTLSEKRKRLADKKKSKKRKAQGSSSNAAPSQDQANHLLEHYQAGRLEEAEALATSLTQHFPKHPFGWKALGAVLKQMGRLGESLAPMQSAVKLSPQDTEAHSNLGVTLQELGRLGEAEASLRQAIALRPDYAEAYSNMGVTLQELGRLGEAEASLRQAIALKPDFAEAHYNFGVTLQELGRLGEAEASLRQAIALKPDYAEAYSNMGVTLQELGRLDEAEASLRQAIALKPDFAEAHYNFGVTLKELGRLDKAEAIYRQAIALKPDYAEAHNNLGNTLQELGRLDEAEASLRKAITLKPDFAEAHSNLGSTLQELGRLGEAEASLRKALALKPDYAEAHYNLGITLQELGRLDDAEASGRQAIALKPDFAKAHNNLGNTLTELGRLNEAEASCRQAIALKPDLVDAHSQLGQVLFIKGQESLALVSIKKALSMDSSSKTSGLLLNVIQSRTTHKKTEPFIEPSNNKIDLNGLMNEPLILNRAVEAELVDRIYEKDGRKLGVTRDARFGNGTCSPDFNFFEDTNPVIQKVAADLTSVMTDFVKSDIFIYDSFFNILGAGGGTTPHAHLTKLDLNLRLAGRKYSLVYYVSVGDQDCADPGILKLYDSDQDILPSEGMIVIIPGSRKHSAIYGGRLNRVMIGVNFYAL